MKLKKKLLAALLAAAMILCSCSESSSVTTESSSSKTDQTTSCSQQTSEQTTTTTAASQAPTTTSSQSPDEQSYPQGVPMWEGTAPNGNKITFIGSMHAAKQDFYPIPEKISKPFSEAEVVAFECDTDEEDSLEAQQLQQDMNLTDGTKLADHISPKAYQILGKHLADLNATTELVDNFKPWAAYETLTALWIMTSDITITNGIDYYLMHKTKTDGKQLVELESSQMQIDLVKNLPEQTYDVLFKLTEDESRQTYNEQNTKIYEYWLKGDLVEIDKMNSLPPDSEFKEAGLTDEEIALVKNRNKLMLDDRNIEMVKGIKELFKSGKKTFVCVGCAHYLGDNGIVSLLEKEGYSFKRI